MDEKQKRDLERFKEKYLNVHVSHPVSPIHSVHNASEKKLQEEKNDE